MQKLEELIHVVNRNKVKTIEVVGSLPARKTMVQEFYEKLTDGTIKNDQDASQYFYGATTSHRNYKELKKRLTERLLNTTLFIDVQQAKYDEAGKAYYNCWKDYAIAKILLGKGAHVNAYALMKKILKQSIRYEFTELNLDITRLLRLYYGTRAFNLREFEHYHELFTYYEEIYRAESLADGLYGKLLAEFFGKSEGEELVKKARAYHELLAPLVKKMDSYRLHLYYYLIQIHGASGPDNYQTIARICQDAIDYFRNNPQYSKTAIAIFSRQQFLVYLQLREFGLGEKLLRKGEKYTPVGSLSWFTNYDYFFLLCLHSKRYQTAFNTLGFILQHPQFKAQPDLVKERWCIYRAYTYYLIGLGKIEGQSPKKFRIHKFLNEVPLFSKAKRGTNIPILVAQILFFILYKQCAKVIDRMEAIEKYGYRHLKQAHTFRSNCFIKMLLVIPKAAFHKTAVIRKTEKLAKQLSTQPLEVSKQVYETEIIPYEDLWELVLESLENQFWK